MQNYMLPYQGAAFTFIYSHHIQYKGNNVIIVEAPRARKKSIRRDKREDSTH